MSRTKQLLCCVVVAVWVSSCRGPSAEVRPSEQAMEHAAPSLPASLDALYPPRAAGPAFMFMMLELSGGFDGVLADAQQGDRAGAKANFTKMAASWDKLGGAVPEWKNAFEPARLQPLQAAVDSGDPQQIFGAAQKVGELCHGCHMQRMALVQYRYRWRPFHAVKTQPTGAEQPVPLRQLMQGMAVSMVGIGNDLAQGQQENAIKNAAAFRAHFAALGTVCKSCHESDRHYFHNAELTGMVADLEQAVSAKPPDQKRVGDLMGAIGMKSCGECHLVHMPAALAQHRLSGGH